MVRHCFLRPIRRDLPSSCNITDFVLWNMSHKEISRRDLEGKVKKCTKKCMYKTAILLSKPTAVSTFSILSFLHKLPKRVRGGIGAQKTPFKI